MKRPHCEWQFIINASPHIRRVKYEAHDQTTYFLQKKAYKTALSAQTHFTLKSFVMTNEDNYIYGFEFMLRTHRRSQSANQVSQVWVSI